MKVKLLSLALSSSVLVAVAAFPSAAQAQIVAEDTFESYSPSTNLNGLNGGFGFAGGYAVGGGSFGYLNEVRNGDPVFGSGNYANLAGGYGGPAFNFFQRTVDVNGAFAEFSDGANVGLDGTSLLGTFDYRTVNGTLAFFLQQPGANGAVTTFFNLASTGADTQLAFRIDFGIENNDTISFFANPTEAVDGTGVPFLVQFGDYSFRTVGFAVNGDTFEGRVDNLRFSQVPEPASAILMLGGAGTLLGLRRRRPGAR